MTSEMTPDRRPAIVGHRGAAGLAPENTLPSFCLAVELGVEWVELDVRLTADGVPVTIHDAELDRTTTGSGPVSEISLADLLALEILIPRAQAASQPTQPAGSGIRIPTLSEALAAIPAPTGCLIELKRDDSREAELVRQVVTAVAAANIEPRVRLISFQESLLAESRRQAPDLPRGIIGSQTLEELFTIAARVGCVAIHPNHRLLTPDLADRCAHAALHLNAWTANDPPSIRRLANLRVEEITTDFPDLAHHTLVDLGLR